VDGMQTSMSWDCTFTALQGDSATCRQRHLYPLLDLCPVLNERLCQMVPQLPTGVRLGRPGAKRECGGSRRGAGDFPFT